MKGAGKDWGGAPTTFGASSTPGMITVLADSPRIYCTGLTEEVNHQMLKDYFGAFGTVQDVYIPHDKATGARKNFCFITMSNHEEQANVCALGQHSLPCGAIVHTTVAEAREITAKPGMANMGQVWSPPVTKGPPSPVATLNKLMDTAFGNAAWGGAGGGLGGGLQGGLAQAGLGGVMNLAMSQLGGMGGMGLAGLAGGVGGGGAGGGAAGQHRLFVFGVPEGLNADMMRGHFARHGEILDIYTPDSRRDLAFITFSSEAELQDALDHSGLRVAGYWVKGLKIAEDRGKGRGGKGGKGFGPY